VSRWFAQHHANEPRDVIIVDAEVAAHVGLAEGEVAGDEDVAEESGIRDADHDLGWTVPLLPTRRAAPSMTNSMLPSVRQPSSKSRKVFPPFVPPAAADLVSFMLPGTASVVTRSLHCRGFSDPLERDLRRRIVPGEKDVIERADRGEGDGGEHSR